MVSDGDLKKRKREIEERLAENAKQREQTKALIDQAQQQAGRLGLEKVQLDAQLKLVTDMAKEAAKPSPQRSRRKAAAGKENTPPE